MEIVAFLAIASLGLVTKGLVALWDRLFDNSDVAFVTWMLLMCAIAFIYDRIVENRRRSGSVTTEEPQSPEH